jgi:serine phosphatase RsbU (regulator of sigma subunit)/signal transduction protein with GAF and PtsI domain
LHLYSIGVGLAGISILVVLTGQVPWAQVGLSPAFFILLSVIIKRAGFHIAPNVTHSLVGMVDLAALLLFGPVTGGLVASLSELAYLLLRAFRHQKRPWAEMLELTLFNAGLKSVMALASGWLYVQAGGGALEQLGPHDVWPLLILFAAWFTMDHLGWGIREGILGGPRQIWDFLRTVWTTSLLVELFPLPMTVIIVFVYNQGNWFVILLLSAGLVAVALVVQRLADTWQQVKRRLAELTALSRVGQAIAHAQLDVDQLCELIYQQASQIVDTSTFHLGLFDDDIYALKIWVQDNVRQPSQTFPLVSDEDIIGWMRRSKQPLLVRDFQQEIESLPARPSYTSETTPRSAVFVPLIAGNEVIGTMAIQSSSPAAFNEDDLRLLSVIGNEAAMAIEKARLYATAQRRARQLTLVSDVSLKVAAITELEELFTQVVHLIQETFGYDHVGIFALDPDSKELTFKASTNPNLRQTCVDLRIGEGIIGWVAQEGQPLLVNDVSKEPRFLYDQAWPQTRAELAVPLKVEERVLGVLDVQSNKTGVFNEDDLFILQTLAAQVAIAIEGARLYAAQQEEAWFTTVLLQAAEATSRVSNLDDVLVTVVRLIPMLVGVDRCGLFLWDHNSQVFLPTQAYGLTPEQEALFVTLQFAPGDALALDEVRRTKAPRVLSGDKLTSSFPSTMIEAFHMHQVLILPLLARGELLGVMLADYTEGAATFNERKVALTAGIANHAAIAIENAQLYEAQQEEAYVSNALLQVAEAVGSLTDLDEILSTIVRLTPILVGVQCCSIYLWNDKEGGFVPAQEYGFSEKQKKWWHHSRPGQHDPLMQEVLTGRPAMIVSDKPDSHRLLGEVTPVPGSLPILALPLSAKGKVLGAMLVDYVGAPERFIERWMNILTGIANQTAIAIENTQLYHQEAERERLKREMEVAREIQASFMPEHCPYLPGWELCAYWQAAYQVGGDFYDFFSLPGERLGLVIADVADKGVPAALFMALSRTLIRVTAHDGRSPARALQRANELIIADAGSDQFVTVFYTILEPQTGILTYASGGHNPPLLMRHNGQIEPLRARGTVLGIVDAIELEEKQVTMQPGDVLVMYTDGVTDAFNADEEEFGITRLSEVIQRTANRDPSDIIAAINSEVMAFVGDMPQFDDFTLVVLKRAEQP